MVRKAGLYYFRKRIPKNYVHIVNKREIKLSLKTSNRKQAKIIASQLLVNVEIGLSSLKNLEKEQVQQGIRSLVNNLKQTIKLFHSSSSVSLLKPSHSTAGSDLGLVEKNTLRQKQISYEQAFNLYKSLTNDNDSTKAITKRSLNLLEKIYPNKTISELTISDAMKARNEMANIPTDYYRFKTINEAKQKSLKRGLNAKTINRHIQKLKSVYETLIKAKFINNEDNPFQIEKAKGGIHTIDDRHSLSREQIIRLFNSPIFKGCFSITSRFKSGDLLVQDGYYWLILIALFTGARANEICQLSPNDIKTHILDNGKTIHYFDIHDGGLRRLKTLSAKRKIPVHSILLELGLLDYAHHRRQQAQEKLLSISKYNKKTKTYSVYASKRFSVLLESIGAKTSKTSLHSTRHSFKDALTQYGVDYEVKKQLLGHAGREVTNQYGSGIPLLKLNEAINKIDYSFIDFEEIKVFNRDGQII